MGTVIITCAPAITFTGPLAPQGYVPSKSQGRASIAYSADGGTLYAMVQDASTFNSGASRFMRQATRTTASPSCQAFRVWKT